jgi:hypothetical protein
MNKLAIIFDNGAIIVSLTIGALITFITGPGIILSFIEGFFKLVSIAVVVLSVCH